MTVTIEFPTNIMGEQYLVEFRRMERFSEAFGLEI